MYAQRPSPILPTPRFTVRLTILGGGGFRVPLVYRALSRGRYAGLIDTVALYDTDPARLSAIRQVLSSMPGLELPPAVEAYTEPESALAGSDVVFAAIREGSTAGRVLDERVALERGVLGQETTGAGGISYALRSIPRMLALADTIRRATDGAWLINFSNPAGMVTQALSPLLGNRVIGICDSPIGLVRRAARAAGFPLVEGSLSGVDYVGLNHLGWLRRLTNDDGDHLPALLADPGLLATFEEGRLFGPTLPRLLGALPNEYLFYYYSQREALASLLSAGQTRGESIRKQQDGVYPRLAAAGPDAYRLWDEARREREEGYLAEARSPGQDRDEADLAGGGYEEVALAAMNALLRQERTELILNVPNNGAIPALPETAVIEVPSEISGTGARPLPVRAPNLHELGLMSAIKAVETAVVDAVTHGSRDAALRAFALHPLVDSTTVAADLLAGYETAFPALPDLWR